MENIFTPVLNAVVYYTDKKYLDRIDYELQKWFGYPCGLEDHNDLEGMLYFLVPEKTSLETLEQQGTYDLPKRACKMLELLDEICYRCKGYGMWNFLSINEIT